MRKIIVISHITLDGVLQAMGGPDEDRSGGFAYGGWVVIMATCERDGDVKNGTVKE